MQQQSGTGPSSSSSSSASGATVASPSSQASSGGSSVAPATAYPIDLASASKVLVRPTEKTNMPTTYRIGNSAGNQMRVVIPSNATPQTYYRQTINLKPDTTANRAQITALPARTVSQASITVSRPQTPTTYHVPARVQTTVAAGIQGPRATITAPIRIPTPPISVANLNTYVRQSVPPSRTSSPSSATIISQQGGAPTWMPNVQVQVPSQLIRAANITSAPRARVVAQTIPAAVNQAGGSNQNATITANVVSQASPQSVVSISGASNPSQAFVATLSPAVLPPQRQITSTLVYTNNSSSTPQSYPSGTINPQRVTLATTTLSPQRGSGVRPIQRLPTANIGVRVPAGSISIRTPPVPVLAPTVLTTIASGGTGGTQNRTGTVSTANISNTIPARIIQVQNPQSGQVIAGGRLPTNLLNIQPLIVSNNRIPSSIQPSLTIAQVSKLTPVAASPVSNSSGSTSTSSLESGTTTLQTASGQQIVVSSAPIISGNLMSNQSGSGSGITQIVNVNAAGSVGSASQIVTVSQGQVIGAPQSLSVSNSGSGGSGTTTVIPIPLAITGGRNAGGIPVSVATLAGGQNSISIVSGGGSTITGIVRTTTSGASGTSGPSLSQSTTMPSILPIAKVTPHLMESVSSSSSAAPYSGTSLYIQTRPQQPSAIVTTVASSGKSNTLNVVSGSGGPGTFLPTSTFYYERVTPSPASSSSQPLPPVVTSSGTPLGLSQGVSTLTTTAITTTSTLAGPVFSISSSALNSSGSTIVTSNVITTSGSSLPSGAGSFAIVAGRNIQPPTAAAVSSSATSFQSVPVRFQPQLLVDGGQAQPIIMTSGGSGNSSQQPAPHMLIPVNPAGSGTTASATSKLESPQSSILRKRALESSPIKAGKDLTQTLIAMGKERFREKERERERERHEREMSPPSRPISTDGSTTVSATSSPGLDQQEQEEIKAMAYANRNANADLPFKPLHEEIFHASNQQPPQPITLESIQAAMQSQQNAAPSAAAASNGSYEQSPRKKPRKQNVAEGLKAGANSLQFYASNAVAAELDVVRMDTGPSGEVNFGPVPLLPPPPQAATPSQKHATTAKSGVVNNSSNNVAVSNAIDVKPDVGVAVAATAAAGSSSKKDGAATAPKDAAALARKPRNVSLLESYKQSWKAANNHFQRYTDVKQREERRPTIVDIANQSHVLQKVNGWKVYHLSAQIEDLCELESQAYDKLDQMLKSMEAAPKQSPEIERINELLKGNMQRSKIIMDGINEARTQIMKIFDHKTHVSDIIQRCASKRNFKKREKT